MLALLAAAHATPSTESQVTIEKVARGVWIHTAMHTIEDYGTFPSNGLLVDTREGLVLVDTAWNDAQTTFVLDWAEEHIGEPVTDAIVTHAHADKMGGMKALAERGVRSWATPLTNTLAPDHDLLPASDTLTTSQLFHGQLEVFSPGPGHSPDNIVVYVPKARFLHGGWLIRPGESSTLGNTGDADVAAWDTTVARVRERFPRSRHVLPSHGPLGDAHLLDHTIALVEAHRARVDASE